MAKSDWHSEYKILSDKLSSKGISIEEVKTALKEQKIETPSWGYSDSGTRFKVFRQPGAARTVYEKFEDAAQVHRFTGICPSVAIHIPWDKMDDYGKLKGHASSLNLSIGAVNPNLFQDEDYMLGSITNADPKIRKKSVNHMIECVDIAKETGSKALSLWFADGTNYPGQGNIRLRKHWMEECLKELYSAMASDMRMLIEYKFFEPGFYHTDLADWGMSYVMSCKCGERAQVLVDLGHHPLGTNIEHIVAFLIDEGKLGGFHFNNKKYADDDLTVGSINPYELFLIFNELIGGENDPSIDMDVAYMIDQSHNVKPKIEATIQSVLNIQVAYAKALIIDRKALYQAQEKGDIVAAEETLLEAYNMDVFPLLKALREEMGLDLDPLEAYKKSGYYEKIVKERASGGSASGLGTG